LEVVGNSRTTEECIVFSVHQLSGVWVSVNEFTGLFNGIECSLSQTLILYLKEKKKSMDELMF